MTVASKWLRGNGPKDNTYWVSFEEPVAEPREVQVTSEEWKPLSPGNPITIAVLPDRTPHSLDSGADVGLEKTMLVIAILFWLSSAAYMTAVVSRWLRSRNTRQVLQVNGSDLHLG